MNSSNTERSVFSKAPFGVIKLDIQKTRAFAARMRLRVDNQGSFDHPIVCAVTNSVVLIDANTVATAILTLEGQPIPDRISHIIPDALQRAFATGLLSLLNGDSFVVEGILRAADGVDFAAVASAWIEDRDLSHSYALLSITKIQHRHQNEHEKAGILSELAHEARISMLGEMTASISHEVNQPLGSIVTSAEAGLRWLNQAEPDVDEIRASLERIASSGRRAGDIISTLKGMARNTKPERNPVELSALIDEAVIILRADLTRRQVDLRLEIGPDLPLVFIDRTQILQVIVNLSTNAAQAMADGQAWNRTLVIRAREHGKQQVLIDVEDSGPGVDPSVRERLFETFYTTKTSGVGMGLPICRSIVEAHGSKLELQSSPYLGARFSFTLAVSDFKI